MNSTLSLDQRYLDFTVKTAPVFETFPGLEPLRHFIFKDLLVRGKGIGFEGHTKHWLRPLFRRARTQNLSDRADVVIWIETAREVIVEALLPVFDELNSRGVRVQLLAFSGPRNLPTSTRHVLYPSRAIPPRWAKEAWQGLCEAESDLRRLDLRRSFYYACADVQALFDETGRILNAMSPKVALCASTQRIGGSALMAACRSRAILSILLQHGILQPAYVPLLADCMVTWGISSTETLVGLGVSPERLLSLGSPRHDSMGPSKNGSARTRLLNELSLPDKPTFVFFSNGNDLIRNGQCPRECATWLELAAMRFQEKVNFVIRLHPNEDGSLYKEWYRNVRVTKNSIDLNTTLDGSDCVGSLCSTVLYDALLYGKAVWQFLGSEWPELADNWRQGLAMRISSQEELHAMIERLLKGANETCCLGPSYERVFANHGRAAKAIADLVQATLTDAPLQSLGTMDVRLKISPSVRTCSKNHPTISPPPRVG